MADSQVTSKIFNIHTTVCRGITKQNISDRDEEALLSKKNKQQISDREKNTVNFLEMHGLEFVLQFTKNTVKSLDFGQDSRKTYPSVRSAKWNKSIGLLVVILLPKNVLLCVTKWQTTYVKNTCQQMYQQRQM